MARRKKLEEAGQSLFCFHGDLNSFMITFEALKRNDYASVVSVGMI
jgi:hypothetical protein